MIKHFSKWVYAILAVCLLAGCSSGAESTTTALEGASSVATSREAETAMTLPQSMVAGVGEVVQGELYGLEVVKVRAKDSYLSNGPTGLPKTVDAEAGYVFIEVMFRLLKEGEQVWQKEELPKITLLDSTGTAFSPGEEFWLVLDEEGGDFDEYILCYSVPVQSTGFQLQYRDLPLIELGTPTLEEN